MKLELITACKLTYPTGKSYEFSSLEEASEFTEKYFNDNPILPKKSRPILTVNAIKLRCNKSEPPKDGIIAEWLDEHTKLHYRAKKSLRKGHNYELQIIHELTDLGYEGLVSSRSQNKRLDNAKIDIAETKDHLSCYIQCKATQNIPNIVNINNECGLKDKPLAIFWKKQSEAKPQDEYVIIPKEYFYTLIKK